MDILKTNQTYIMDQFHLQILLLRFNLHQYLQYFIL